MAHVLAHPSQPDGCKIHAFYIWASDLERIGARSSLPASFLRITKGVPRFSVCGKTSAWQSGSWGKVRFYLFYRGAWDAFDWWVKNIVFNMTLCLWPKFPSNPSRMNDFMFMHHAGMEGAEGIMNFQGSHWRPIGSNVAPVCKWAFECLKEHPLQ